MSEAGKGDRGRRVDVVLIDDVYTEPRSMVAAMMAAAHAAAAEVAGGGVWEGDEEILIPPAVRPHALRMATIWWRAADQLQKYDSIKRDEPAPDEDAPEQNARSRSRGDWPAR